MAKKANIKEENLGKKKKHNLNIVASFSAVPFPGVPLPYALERDDQLPEFEKGMKAEIPVCLFPVLNPNAPVNPDNLSPVGVAMKVLKILDLPEGNKSVFLLGGERVRLCECMQTGPSTFQGVVEPEPDKISRKNDEFFNTMMQLITEDYEYVKSYFSDMMKVQMAAPKELAEDPHSYLNFIIVTSPIDYNERLNLLQESDIRKRAEKTYMLLEKVKEQIELRKEIFSRAAAGIEKEQREHFLRQQIREIQYEIGEGDENDISSLEARGEAMPWPEYAAQAFDRELKKLKRFSPNSPDYAIQYTYLDTLLSLPWNRVKEGEIEIQKVEEGLDKDHFGLKNVKERIIEHIAVLKMRGDMRSPILCLYGPPGVGKTSLCKSVAESIGREYTRISLGGLHDETQLRGHRRTYIGALPGRIISALQKLESNNPVFVLDEVDKIGHDHRGDPAQALLEILDPEQNSRFHDNYLDVDYDLSKIFFIATANSLAGISAPLLDRMELIDISGYLLEEKREIATRHLVPKLLESHGFKKNEVRFTQDGLDVIITNYTRESGVRKLEKTIAKILRKIAVKKAKGEKFPKKIDGKKAMELLGKEDVIPEIYKDNLPAGVVPGLAWTSVGGEILYFESALSEGKGNLTLTGNLGDVMKESATIALQWIKSNAGNLGIDPARFAKTDVHLHVPEGAVPKDGPSAGITMICSMVSSFKGQKVTPRLAMTGEATLSGRVLPVGGIKEKILAANRAGITDIVLSSVNRRDIEEIDACYVEGLNFHYVDTIADVVAIALP